jgi:hypothetical protein
MLKTLIKIGQKHGLTPREFIYHLTIPGPGRMDKVFYPFYVLSRHQAKANQWDWTTVNALASHLIRNLKVQCNRYAEAVGHGRILLTRQL